jgi:hypothetical protein
MFSLILTPLLTALAAHAIITPTSPDSSTVVKVGGQITALWNADTTGSWTNVEIQLMTGDNLNVRYTFLDTRQCLVYLVL